MMTETAERTKESWAYHNECIWWEEIPVAHMYKGSENENEPVEMDANGAFIVRVCNSHADLLKACKEAQAALPDDWSLIYVLHAAIAKAEGTE